MFPFVCRLLAPNPELSDLIRDMGVEPVTHAGVVARFVLPELGAVLPEDRRQLLQHIRTHWAELKTDDSLVNSLKEVHGLTHLKEDTFVDFSQRGTLVELT